MAIPLLKELVLMGGHLRGLFAKSSRVMMGSMVLQVPTVTFECAMCDFCTIMQTILTLSGWLLTQRANLTRLVLGSS